MYSATWFDLFLKPIAAEQTAREVAWVASHVPKPAYHTLLDVGCGWGRHAHLLAQRGYQVTGIDTNAEALAQARRRDDAGVIYHHHDMRALDRLALTYDVITILWQSFGYFDATTNAAVIAQVSHRLRPHGRLILDVYHRAFFEAHQGERSFTRNGLAITERKVMHGDRLVVELDYGIEHPGDRFDWQVFTPDDLCALGDMHGLTRRVACSDFNDHVPPTGSSPRMQIVFEKR